MNAFLVFAVVFGVASADVSSLGYQYNAPSVSYGAPAQQVSSASNYNAAYSTVAPIASSFAFKGQSQGVRGSQGVVSYPVGSVGAVFPSAGGASFQSSGGSGYQSGVGSSFQSLSSGSGYQSGVGSGYQAGGAGYQAAGVGSGYQSSGSGFQSGSSGSGYQFGGQSGNAGLGYQSSGSVGSGSGSFGGAGSVQGFQGSSQYQSQKFQQQQQVQFLQQPAQVFKHFYVHAAPEDEEVAKPRNPVVLPPAQKHYKIIFIKTPAPAGGAAAVAPVVPQSEEKTIVYVLVKKPEEYQDVAVPKIDQKPPSKPEVYFIKYKNKEDSQAVINNIVSDYNKGQQSVSFSGLGAEAGGAGAGAGGAGFSGVSAGLGGAGFSGSSGVSESSSSGFSGSSGLSGFSGSSDLSGFSGSSGLSGFSGSSGLSGLSGSIGSVGSGVSVNSGSFSGQYDSGNAASSIGPFVASSTESGLSAASFGQGGESQVSGSFGSGGYSQGGSLVGVTISKSEPISQAVTSGYESGDLVSGVVGLSHGVAGIGGASSTISYDVSSVSSQGVPHESYGVPNFKKQ